MSDKDPCPKGTINYPDDDVQQVAAALADANFGSGLSDAYYRKADDALKRLVAKLHDANRQRAIGVRMAADKADDERLGDGWVGHWLRDFADRLESGEVDGG